MSLNTEPDNLRPALAGAAQAALQNAYAPYVGPSCGAAIALADGTIYAGSSFENVGFVHGIEALEAAFGQALTCPERPKDRKIAIKAVYLCYEDQPERKRYLPGPLALRWLKLWAADKGQIYYASAEGGVFDTESFDQCLGVLPPVEFDEDVFYAHAQKRQAETVRHAMFAEGKLARLFDTRLCALDVWSHYAVGAMVESERGGCYFGCNAEPTGNKAFHAEAMALAAMVSAEGGEARIKRVTILTAGAPGVPCGGCRQNINELATDATEIVGINLAGETRHYRHRDLLPHDFGRDALDVVL